MNNSIVERATLMEAQMQKQMTVAKVAKTIKNKTPNPDKAMVGNIKEAPSIIKRTALQQYANTRPNKGNVKERVGGSDEDTPTIRGGSPRASASAPSVPRPDASNMRSMASMDAIKKARGAFKPSVAGSIANGARNIAAKGVGMLKRAI